MRWERDGVAERVLQLGPSMVRVPQVMDRVMVLLVMSMAGEGVAGDGRW